MARRRILPVFVPHQGCTYRCVFCNQHTISGAVGPTAAESALAEIQRASTFLRGKPAELAFYGGSFTAIPEAEQESLLEAAGAFLALSEENTLRVSTRPDAVDCGALARLRSHGVTTVELGVQSTDREVLGLSGRPTDPASTAGAVALLRQYGMAVILQMMTGLPGDTRERSVKTARDLIALAPDGVRIYPTVVIRGTALEAMYRRGAYTPHTVEEAVDLCAELLPMFQAAGIPVIRLGLNPTEELGGGEAVAGAYHPALGQLVRSRVYLRAAEPVAARHRGAEELVLGVDEGEISTMVGQRRANVLELERRFGIGRVRVRAAEAGPFSVLPISAKVY